MENQNQDEMEGEPELAPVTCPRCGYEIESEPWPDTCPKCMKRLDLPAQFAYCRGHNAFTVGQDILMKISPKTRRKNIFTNDEMEGVLYYQQAYSSLQVAFKGELAESQRQLAIKMASAMSRVFVVHEMVSPLEAAYWSCLLTEMNSQLEIAALSEKMENKDPARKVGFVQRARWRLRIRQLKKALIELDGKISYIEKTIEFADRPRLRRRSV